MRKQIQALDESPTYRGFKDYDLFKVVKSTNVGSQGDILFIVIWGNLKDIAFYKMEKGKDPKKIEDRYTASSAFYPVIPIRDFDKLLADGKITPLSSEAEWDKGNVDLEDIKDVLVNLNLPEIIQEPLTAIIRSSGEYFSINFGDDEAIQKEYYLKVEKALSRRGISTLSTFQQVLSANRLSVMYIPKIQM